MRIFKHVLAGAAILAATTTVSVAQNYPERPVTVVVPFAAGGPSDAIARLVGRSLSETLGQQFVIENVGGAGGTLGAADAARAEPDGYTLLVAHVALAAGASLYPNLDYDTETAFAPIGTINTGPMVLLTRNSLDVADGAALIEMMRTQGQDLNMGHAGIGSNSHLCGLLLEDALGVKFTQVAYQGTGPAMNDLMAGNIDLLCDQSTTSIPQIQGGTVKGYAVTSPVRLDALPDLPTLQELGLTDFNFTIWHGLYAPAGTPDDIVAKLNEALQTALADPIILERFTEVGTTTFPEDQRSPEAHASIFQAEIDTWRRLLADQDN